MTMKHNAIKCEWLEKKTLLISAIELLIEYINVFPLCITMTDIMQVVDSLPRKYQPADIVTANSWWHGDTRGESNII